MKWIWSQTRLLLRKKSAIFTFLVLYGMVLVNFVHNVYEYRGRDVLNMYHPMKLLLLSSHSRGYYFLEQYFLVLLVIPAGFAYFEDHKSRMEAYWASRTGLEQYYFGKYMAVFLSTFLVFSVPLLLEAVLNCIAFPMEASGDPSNITRYEHAGAERRYLFSRFYAWSPYFYALLRIVLFGVMSGVLAAFTMAVSTFRFFRFRILLFLPVYILGYVSFYADQSASLRRTVNYQSYLDFYNPAAKDGVAFCVALLSIFLAGVGILYWRERKAII